MASLGYNDPDGTVHCNLCEWSKECGPNMERIEHELREHLKTEHGLPLTYRVDEDTGRVVEIP